MRFVVLGSSPGLWTNIEYWIAVAAAVCEPRIDQSSEPLVLRHPIPRHKLQRTPRRQAGCNPKLVFLDCLKAVAGRVKLNKDGFWLHKFRATFATRCLWAGVDLRTVQLWLGHSDIESTMRYLKPSRSQQTRDKVNAIFAQRPKGACLPKWCYHKTMFSRDARLEALWLDE